MLVPTYEYEDAAKKLGAKYVVGVDEAGRGPLAGPVVAGAVRIPSEAIPILAAKVNDSKKLTAKQREDMYDLVTEHCVWSFGVVDNKTIDDINILEATKQAMHTALMLLENVDYAMIDGTVKLRNLAYPQQQIIKGDAKSISIAAASIVAKVIHDDILLDMDEEFPMYGFAKHKGYGTKQHRDAIKEFGPCRYHRLNFKGVREYVRC